MKWERIKYLRKVKFLGLFEIKVKPILKTGIEIPYKSKEYYLSDINKWVRPFCIIDWEYYSGGFIGRK